MDINEECVELYNLISSNFNAMGFISDAIYNHDRYAYNSNFVLLELTPPCINTCRKMREQLRQTDKFLKINDKYCMIEYPFIDSLSARKAFENMSEKILKSNIQYRYSIILIDTKDIKAKDVIRELASDICHTEFIFD